jgi:putative addiction module component (TIGR02574 family)
MSNLHDEIANLSTAQKFELLDVLWASIESDAPARTGEQRSKLDDRVAAYKRNPLDVVSWEQVRAGLLKKQ